MIQSKSRALADRHDARIARYVSLDPRPVSSRFSVLRSLSLPIDPLPFPHNLGEVSFSILHISVDSRAIRSLRPSKLSVRRRARRGSTPHSTHPPPIIWAPGTSSQPAGCLRLRAAPKSGAKVLRTVWAPQKLKYNRNFLLAEEHPLCLFSTTQKTLHHNITQWVSQKFTPKSPGPPFTLSAPMTGRLTWPRTAMLLSRELFPRNVLRIMPTACTST